MLNKILATGALFLTTASSGALALEGLSIKQKIVAVSLNALGVAMAGMVNVRPERRELP